MWSDWTEAVCKGYPVWFCLCTLWSPCGAFTCFVWPASWASPEGRWAEALGVASSRPTRFCRSSSKAVSPLTVTALNQFTANAGLGKTCGVNGHMEGKMLGGPTLQNVLFELGACLWPSLAP